MARRPRRLNVRCDAMNPVLTVTRSRRWANRVVYVVRANRKIRKVNGQKYGSRILYIGMTSVGKLRPANSSCWKADKVFKDKTRGIRRGVKRLDVHLVNCDGRQGVNIWRKLESSLLAAFRDVHDGQLPVYNRLGKKARVATRYFRTGHLKSLIRRLSV